ncbi:unnamed protein product [Closterium sp. Naga37s-1]|nr:unnamed protein product [Closterium sp. Naga37s-1]
METTSPSGRAEWLHGVDGETSSFPSAAFVAANPADDDSTGFSTSAIGITDLDMDTPLTDPFLTDSPPVVARALQDENESLVSVVEQQHQSIAALRHRATTAEREKRSLKDEVALLREALAARDEQMESLAAREEEAEEERELVEQERAEDAESEDEAQAADGISAQFVVGSRTGNRAEDSSGMALPAGTRTRRREGTICGGGGGDGGAGGGEAWREEDGEQKEVVCGYHGCGDERGFRIRDGVACRGVREKACGTHCGNPTCWEQSEEQNLCASSALLSPRRHFAPYPPSALMCAAPFCNTPGSSAAAASYSLPIPYPAVAATLSSPAGATAGPAGGSLVADPAAAAAAAAASSAAAASAAAAAASSSAAAAAAAAATAVEELPVSAVYSMLLQHQQLLQLLLVRDTLLATTTPAANLLTPSSVTPVTVTPVGGLGFRGGMEGGALAGRRSNDMWAVPLCFGAAGGVAAVSCLWALLLALAAIGCWAICASAQCASPLQSCDFYFYGYDKAVPVLKLKSVRDEKVVTTGLRWKGQSLFVETATTLGNSTCKVVGQKKVFCDNYFFFRPRGGKKSYEKYINRSDRLGIRPIPKWKLRQLSNQCIQMGVDSAKIKILKAKTQNASVWINPNDNNAEFPQKRRCVAFKIVTA